MRRGLTTFYWDEDPEDMVRTEPVFTYGDEYESDGESARHWDYQDAIRKKPSKRSSSEQLLIDVMDQNQIATNRAKCKASTAADQFSSSSSNNGSDAVVDLATPEKSQSGTNGDGDDNGDDKIYGRSHV